MDANLRQAIDSRTHIACDTRIRELETQLEEARRKAKACEEWWDFYKDSQLQAERTKREEAIARGEMLYWRLEAEFIVRGYWLAERTNYIENAVQPSGHRYACALEDWGRERPDEGPPLCTCGFEAERRLSEAHWMLCANCKPLFEEPREDWPCMNCCLVAVQASQTKAEAVCPHGYQAGCSDVECEGTRFGRESWAKECCAGCSDCDWTACKKHTGFHCCISQTEPEERITVDMSMRDPTTIVEGDV